MYKGITVSCLFTLITLSAIGQQRIWGGANDVNGSFDGGLNDWQTVGVSSSNPDSAMNAVWLWTPDGTGSDGNSWVGAPIGSETASNGAAIFNSDFLDGAGSGNPGVGAAPSPHSGILISPRIDCSQFGSITLAFNQYYRNFDAHTFVEISNDDGFSWKTIELNEDVASHNTNNINERVVLNISQWAAGSDQVRIQFRFDGGYYFWIIDDVELTSLPYSDLSLPDDSILYAPQSYATPACHIQDDTLVFDCVVMNNRALNQTNVRFQGRVLNAIGSVIWTDTIKIDTLESKSSMNIRLSNSFVPGLLSPGRYSMVYTVLVPGAVDLSPSDNLRFRVFEVSQLTYSKDRSPTTSYNFGQNQPHTHGAVYRTSASCQEQYILSRLEFVVAVNDADGPLEGKSVDCYFMKLTPEMNNGFEGFDTTVPFSDGNHPNLDMIGFTQRVFNSGEESFELLELDAQGTFVDFSNFDTIPQIDIASGETYIIMMDYAGDNEVLFHGYDEDHSAIGQISSIVYRPNDNTWFLGGFSGGPGITLRMVLDLKTTVDHEPLPEGSVELFPNPADDILNVKVSLSNALNTTITLADMTGRVFWNDSYQMIQTGILTVPVSGLAPGAYHIRVATPEGTSTQKVMIQ